MKVEKSTSRSVRNLLIMPGMQFKILGYLVAFFILVCSSLYASVFLLFWRIDQKAMSVGIPQGHVFYRFMSEQKAGLDALFLGLAVIYLVLLILAILVLTHRIAGPIFKLQKHLQTLTIEETQDFQLRQKDFFKELTLIMKELQNKMKGRF